MRPKNQAPEVSARADQSDPSIDRVRCEVSSGKRKGAHWSRVTNQREGQDRELRTRVVWETIISKLFYTYNLSYLSI